MLNAFTIDLEEWFSPHNLRGVIDMEEWDRLESRIEDVTRSLLALLALRNVEATFFILGWVAERHPDLIREIAAAGHEIASHGYSHRLITTMAPDEFERDLDRALEITEKITGRKILGYRAPAFSITRRTSWALDILARKSLLYDSSIFPMGLHPDYGMPDAPLGIHRRANGLIEVPMSCAVIAGKRIPCGGGGYFRLLPYGVTRRLMHRCNRQGRPVIFYIHPWELDPDHPEIPLSRIQHFRHYHNLEKTLRKLEYLLLDYRFTSIRTLIGADELTKEQGFNAGLLLCGAAAG